MLLEANIDALVGPSHHYGGLGVGNVASIEHQMQTSHPCRAALEGLEKAELLANQGIPQFIWLPPQRPRYDLLEELGFAGSPGEQLRQAAAEAPHVLSAAYSSAFMWAANAATVTPAVDAQDGLYHFSLANLLSSWHRGSESQERARDLELLLGSSPRCRVHSALPCVFPLRDEGAANHMRVCDPSGAQAMHLFVFGADESHDLPHEAFLPRQSRAACEAICRRHALPRDACWFLRQHPRAIAAGVFHNDVIATSHQHLLLHHEYAFANSDEELQALANRFEARAGHQLVRLIITEQELSLNQAVESYFFNSQIVTPQARSPAKDVPRMLLVCPQQCAQIDAARRLVERITADPENPIDSVRYVSLAESMAGGGGPACLRLRVPVEPEFLDTMHPGLRVDARLLDQLRTVIEREYPAQVSFTDLSNHDYAQQIQRATHCLREIFAGP